MSDLTRSDVAIVGAGPAGAWAARRLAERGAQVTIFDDSHPREKPCGGGVTGRALGLVGPALDGAGLPAVVVETARFEADGRVVTVPLAADGVTPASTLVVAPRAAFDAALLRTAEAAGARRVDARVVEVTAGPHGVTLTTRRGLHRADWVVAADGATSLIRRRLYRPFERTDLSIATGVYIHGCTSREIVVRFSFEPPGYLWSFPRPDHLAIGICAQADRTRAALLRHEVAAWIDRAGLAAGARREPYAWPIPSLSAAAWATARLAGDRWLLAGDAAGLVDPITREGIYWALESGASAAASLAGADPAARYTEQLRDTIVPELAAAARLRSGFFRRGFIALLLEALAHSRPVRAVMADLVAGRQPYATLRRRLIRTREWKLAWRMARHRE